MDHAVVRSYCKTLTLLYNEQEEWLAAKAANDGNHTDLGRLSVEGLPNDGAADVEIKVVGHQAISEYVINPMLAKLGADIDSTITALSEEILS